MGANTNAPEPVARLTGRDSSKNPSAIVAPAVSPETFDLRPWAAARRYRVRLDESFDHEADAATRGDGRAYVEVPGRRGTLYPLGPTNVAAWTATRGVLAALLALDPAVQIHQRGEAEAVVRFPAPLLDAVAAVIRPRRRRVLDSARARAIGAGTAFSGAQARENGPGRDGWAGDEK